MFGARVFTALRTSKFIKVSSEEVDVVGCSDVVDGLTGDSLEGMAWGAAFLAVTLLRCSSRSLQRAVSISTVSARSFFSVASNASSVLQASRSTFRFSFSNCSGVKASVSLTFLPGFGLEGATKGIVDRSEEVVVVEVFEDCDDDG